jgi:hypothetical protein
LTALALAVEQAAMQRASRIAAEFTGPGRKIHPDIPWERMNESARTAAHTTAQQIAVAIEQASKGGDREG